MRNKKGIKTTIVAVCIGLLGIATYVLWLFGKIDETQLEKGLSAIAVIGSTVGLYLAKDADKSHTRE